MPIVAFESLTICYDIHHPPSSSTPSSSTYVVLINGLADSKETWASQVPALIAAGYKVLTFDNRGISATSAPAGPYSASLLATDTYNLIQHLRIDRFHLMGVSMGGMIAQQYALNYPETLLSLTLACTYTAPGPFCSRMFSIWADAAPIMGVSFIMREVILWAFTTDFFNNPERMEELHQVEEEMKSLTMSTTSYLSQLELIRTFDVSKDISKIDLPTLVIAGEQDILIPVDLSRMIHDLIPRSRWTTVKGGHACMWEYPDSFNTAFLDFLDGLQTTSAS